MGRDNLWRDNILCELSLVFSIRIVKLYSILRKERDEFVMSKQLMRSATSIGANIAESQGCQTTPDFIAKLHISLKEGRESEYWLILLRRTNYLSQDEYESLQADLDTIIGLLVSILKSAKKNLNP